MSMIEQQVKELRELADGYKVADRPLAANMLYQAADTIEALYEKVTAANMERSERYYNGEWIPCEERLPEDRIDVLVWFEYFRYGEYNRLFQTKGISYTFDGKWSGFVNGSSGWSQLKIIAWQPMPEDYRP